MNKNFVFFLLIGLTVNLCRGKTYEEFEALIDTFDPKAIIENHNQDFGSSDKKMFGQELLVFVTPWNPLGSEWAVQYAKKIDYLSPVWFDFRIQPTASQGLNFFIEGDHNVNKTFLQALKEANPKIQIYPRVYLEGNLFEKLLELSNHWEIEVIADKIVSSFQHYNEFDGIVFDSPLLLYSKQIHFDLIGLVEKISQKLGFLNKNLIISSLSDKPNAILAPQLLEKLTLLSYKILICTYDFVSVETPDPYLAPINWVQQNIEKFIDQTNLGIKTIQRKVLMGIPFYGYQVNFNQRKKDAIVNREFLDILKTQSLKIEWNSKYKECISRYNDSKFNDQIYMAFPCLKFLKSRLELFEEYQVGAFLWEGGQGLQYFYELF